MTIFSKLLEISTLITLTAGCVSCGSTAEKPTPRPDPDLPYTASWSAEPGINLLSREAELVRAAMESGTYTSLYSLEGSFTGYAEAVRTHPSFGEPNMPVHVRYGTGDRSNVEEMTYLFHITNLNVTATQITADICDEIQYARTEKYPNPRRHGFSWAVTLRNTGDSPGVAGIPDTDPVGRDPRSRRIPNWDVFRTWKVVELDPLGSDRYAETGNPACQNWWLSRHPEGWVQWKYTSSPPGEVPGTPVAPQYPEWIGPADTE